MLRLCRLIAEALAAAFGVGLVLILLLAWRLSVSPFTATFLTPTLETTLEHRVPGTKAQLPPPVLTWSGDDRTIAVHVENIRLEDAQGHALAQIPSFDAKISAIGVLFGQFWPEDLTIDHPQIHLERDAGGHFTFGGAPVGASNTPEKAESVAAVLQRLTEDFSRALLMRQLSITRAVFDVHDAATGKDWVVSMPEISLSRTVLSAAEDRITYGAMSGHARVEATQQVGTAAIDMRYVYDPTKQQHLLSAVFTDVTPAFFAGGHPETLGLAPAAMLDLPLTGKISLRLDDVFKPEALTAQIHGDSGHFVDSSLWDAPCPIAALDLNVAYDRAARTLEIHDTQIDLGGPVLTLKLKGSATQDSLPLDFKLLLTAENLPMNRYGAIVPKTLGPDPRIWMVAHMRDGLYTHAEMTTEGSWSAEDPLNPVFRKADGTIALTGTTLTYLDGMPPVEQVSAAAVFDQDHMDIKILDGHAGAIRMQPFTLVIDGLSKENQTIDIPLKVAGTVPDILRLLDHPPLRYPTALGLAPDGMTGKAEGEVRFRFPLQKDLRMKDLGIDATAALSGIASTTLVPGLALDQGDETLTLTTDGLALKGKIDINKVPLRVTWQEAFAPKRGENLRHITLLGSLREDQAKALGLSLFDGTKGAMPLSLDLRKRDKNTLRVDGGLDLTPAAAVVSMLNWKKAAGVPAKLLFSAVSDQNDAIRLSRLSLHGQGVTIEGTGRFSKDMSHLLSLKLAPLIAGRTNATLALTQDFGAAPSLTLDASGTSLDISGLRSHTENSDEKITRTENYTLNIAKLYTSETGAMTQVTARATRDSDGWAMIDFKGVAQGDTPMTLSLTPQADGSRSLSLQSESFGKVMAGLGFTDTIQGGALTVTGHSVPTDPHTLDGEIKIAGFSVEKLPVLMLLINAASPFGFTDILTDRASFDHLDGAFRWQGQSLSLSHIHAAGSAVGINLDGKINMETGAAALKGTLVPFSSVNRLLGWLPVIGDLLTGGKDQGVLAVSFGISGALQDPKISVNPVSLLTPGFLRTLFFGEKEEEEP